MDLSGMSVCPAPSTVIVLLLTLLWLVLPRVWRSRSPLAAALVPLALYVADGWLVVFRTLEGMAISGPHSMAPIAAGLAEARRRVVFGLVVSAFMLAIFTIVRRRDAFRAGGIVVGCAILIAIATVATLAYAIFAIAGVLAIVALWKRPRVTKGSPDRQELSPGEP